MTDRIDETPQEIIDRILKERGKDRETMVRNRKGRSYVGGSFVKDGDHLDVNGNDRKKGKPVQKTVEEPDSKPIFEPIIPPVQEDEED